MINMYFLLRCGWKRKTKSTFEIRRQRNKAKRLFLFLSDKFENFFQQKEIKDSSDVFQEHNPLRINKIEF